MAKYFNYYNIIILFVFCLVFTDCARFNAIGGLGLALLNNNGLTGSELSDTVALSPPASPYYLSVTQTSGNTAINEAGLTDTYSLVLSKEPDADVTVDITPDAQVKIDGSAVMQTFTFTPADWSIPQNITVSAVNDSVAEGVHTSVLTHSVNSLDSNYNGISVDTISVTITDNDTAALILTHTGGTGAVGEAGLTDSYSIQLGSQPVADVVVQVSTGTDLTIEGGSAPLTRTFTSANWSTPQSISVEAVNDLIEEGGHSGTITHTLSSADPVYGAMASAGVSFNITDNDTAGIKITESGGSTDISEDGTQDTYEIVLESEPVGDVVITLTPDAQSAVNGVTTPVILTFTSLNWSAAQTVTVSARDDLVGEGAHVGAVSHTASSVDAYYNGKAINSVNANITDNDNLIIVTESGGASAAVELGASDSYTVVLASAPLADVDITVTPDAQTSVNGGNLPVVLTFTTANWSSVQTVTIGARDDLIVEGPHTGGVTHSTASADTNFNGLIPAPVSLSISDDDIDLDFVAVGSNNIRAVSNNGVNWDDSKEVNAFRSVAFDNGVFIAVGKGGRRAVSSDGITWSFDVSEGLELRGVCAGNGVFLAVGVDGRRIRSTDNGVSWVNDTGATDPGINFNACAYGNGVFVAVGDNGRRIRSTDDGLTWKDDVDGGYSLKGITYGGGNFVAVGSSGRRIISSDDGLNWSNDVSGGESLYSITYGNSLFVAVGSQQRRMTSSDGITWNNDQTGAWHTFYSVSYLSGYFVVVGTYGKRFRSADGITWTDEAGGSSSDFTLMSIASGNSRLVSVGFNARRIISLDGQTWSNDVWEAENFRGVAYGAPGFVAIGTRGVRCFSPNGVTWTSCTQGGAELNAVAYGGGKFIAVGKSGRRIISTDGVNWTNDQSGGSRLRSIAYGGGYFVAVGNSGRRVRSSDGITWSNDTSGGGTLRAIAYGGGTFVAIGDGGRRVISVDLGVNWTNDVSAGDHLYAIAYGNGVFVAAGGYKRRLVSPDGVTWTNDVNSGVSQNIRGVAYANGVFMIVGDGGFHMRSIDNGVTWTDEVNNSGSAFHAIVAGP